MGWIYRVTNQINSKVYIGKTEELNPLTRWKEHKRNYKKEWGGKRPFYNAMKKYGVENFAFEVIDQCDDSDELCELEMYYIDKYRSFVGFKDCHGYNASLGGDGRAYIILDENEVIKFHIENDYIVGLTAKHFEVDEKVIKKILTKHNIGWQSLKDIVKQRFIREYGGLVCLSFDCDQVIKIYNSPIDAVKELGVRYETLCDSYRPYHKTHHAYGYTWYRLSDLPEEYTPLLEDYYAEHLYDDNLEIDDEDLEYLY